MNKEPCCKIKVCILYSWQGVSPPSPQFTIYMYYLIIQLWTVMQDVNLNKGVRDLCLFQLLFCKLLVNWGNLFYTVNHALYCMGDPPEDIYCQHYRLYVYERKYKNQQQDLILNSLFLEINNWCISTTFI